MPRITMLVNTREILCQARQQGYALPAPDFIDLDSARAFVQTAEKLQKPLILSYAQALEGILTLEEAAAIGKLLAEQAQIPVALHLAHAKNVTAEAEIGHVGQGENFASFENSENIYTTPEEAIEFVALTQVDSLAVSSGTLHGIYKGREKPALNFECLHKLAETISVPLVLHGGSGTGDDNLHRCATEGISKINIFTDFLTAAMDRIQAGSATDYFAVKREVNQGMSEVLEHYFTVFAKD